MICQSDHVTITFASKKLATAEGRFAKSGRAQRDLKSFYHYNAVLSDVKGKFQESETIQIITGLDSSSTTGNIYLCASGATEKK